MRTQAPKWNECKIDPSDVTLLLIGRRGAKTERKATTMPQSLSKLALHLTFSTQDRLRALAYPELRTQLEGYVVGILKNLGCPSLSTRVVIDHLHTLFLLSRTESVSSVVQTVKQESSKWIKQQMPEIEDPYLIKFHWQKGYSVFSVNESLIPRVKTYIENQENHHKRMTFQEEYLGLLKKHNIAYDERYIWD